MKRTVCVVALLAMAVSAFAATIALSSYLPTARDVKGWKPVGGAMVDARGDDISRIYDGGYEFYVHNGVTEAARNLYMRDKNSVEVTIHRMKNERMAKAFFEHWQKELKVKKIQKEAGSSYFTSPKPGQGWLLSGTYLVSAVPSTSGSVAEKDAETFLLAVEKRIRTIDAEQAKGKTKHK